jgi:hypothetical protein
VIDNAPRQIAVCALLAEDERRQAVYGAVSLAFSPTEGYAAVWALPNADQFGSPRTRFESRPAQWTWAAAAIAAMVVWAGYLRIRRSEFALYAICGLKGHRIATIAGTELLFTVCAASGTAGAVLAGLALTHGTRAADVTVGLLGGARFGVAAVLACCALAIHAGFAATRNTFQALKDR